MKTNTENNLEKLEQTISQEYKWLEKLIASRVNEIDPYVNEQYSLEAEDISKNTDVYSTLCKQFQWMETERIIVLMAMSPLFRPELLKPFRTSSKIRAFLYGKKVIEVDAVPTFKEVFFLLVGKDLDARVHYTYLLNGGYTLFKDRILDKKKLEEEARGSIESNMLDTPLLMTEEFFYQMSTGNLYDPDFSSSFPARKITTHMEWSDLMLNEDTEREVRHMADWIESLDDMTNLEESGEEIKGYKSILHGPPGTGKSLTASIIGKKLKRAVYRIDLSMVVSKYVGETEKNLGNIFDLANNRNWILFFDEGDALFGKRSQTKSSQDRYANQEVSYLLQRMEEHQGVILLATNKLNNLDEAFLRRFQTRIFFPKPDALQRKKLWQIAYGKEYKLETEGFLDRLAEKYVITAAEIKNVKHYTIVRAMSKKKKLVTEEDVLHGLLLELQKSNKTL